MSMITKCFLIVFAVLCCMQLAEMARIPRSDSPASSKEVFEKQLTGFFHNFTAAMQNLPRDERVQGLTEAAGLETTIRQILTLIQPANIPGSSQFSLTS